MRCVEVEPNVQRLLDREANDRQESALLEHLAECPACSRRFWPMLAAVAAIERAAPYEPTAELYDRVLSRIEIPAVGGGGKTGRRWWSAAAVAAAAVLALVVARPGMDPIGAGPSEEAQQQSAPLPGALMATCLVGGGPGLGGGVVLASVSTALVQVSIERELADQAEPVRVAVCMTRLPDDLTGGRPAAPLATWGLMVPLISTEAGPSLGL